MPIYPSNCFPESFYYLNLTPARYYKWHTDTSPNVLYFFWQLFPLTTSLPRPLNGLVVCSCPLFSQNSCCRLCWGIFRQFRLLDVLQWLPISLKTEAALPREQSGPSVSSSSITSSLPMVAAVAVIGRFFHLRTEPYSCSPQDLCMF